MVGVAVVAVAVERPGGIGLAHFELDIELDQLGLDTEPGCFAQAVEQEIAAVLGVQS